MLGQGCGTAQGASPARPVLRGPRPGAAALGLCTSKGSSCRLRGPLGAGSQAHSMTAAACPKRAQGGMCHAAPGAPAGSQVSVDPVPNSTQSPSRGGQLWWAVPQAGGEGNGEGRTVWRAGVGCSSHQGPAAATLVLTPAPLASWPCRRLRLWQCGASDSAPRLPPAGQPCPVWPKAGCRPLQKASSQRSLRLEGWR